VINSERTGEPEERHMRIGMLATVVAALLGVIAQAQDAAKKNADIKKDMDSLQGTWLAVSAEREGEKAPAERVKGIKLVFKDDVVTHRQENKYELDPTQSPKTIDLRPVESADEEKTIKGIYEIKGDDLTVCVSLPGGKRPTEFASKPGSGAALIVLKKSK
jgi:uncharacterized protein (TIGR03067 family)